MKDVLPPPGREIAMHSHRVVSFQSSATFDNVTTGRALIEHSIERCALGREIDTHSHRYRSCQQHLVTRRGEGLG